MCLLRYRTPPLLPQRAAASNRHHLSQAAYLVQEVMRQLRVQTEMEVQPSRIQTELKKLWPWTIIHNLSHQVCLRPRETSLSSKSQWISPKISLVWWNSLSRHRLRRNRIRKYSSNNSISINPKISMATCQTNNSPSPISGKIHSTSTSPPCSNSNSLQIKWECSTKAPNNSHLISPLTYLKTKLCLQASFLKIPLAQIPLNYFSKCSQILVLSVTWSAS